MAVTPPFSVRRMGSEDAPAIRELAGRLDRWFDLQGLARIAQDLGSHAGFVATQGGRLVGFATWSRVDAEVAELSWMGVDENLHHRGIGTVLLAALVTELRSHAFRSLEVSTVADNVDYEPYARTRRFYRARGFVDFRVDPLYWGSGNDRYDRLVLRRDLASTSEARTNADASPQIGGDPVGESQASFKPA